MSTKPTMECPECKGAGGWFEDKWSHPGGHYTSDSECGTCEGTGEVTAECSECKAPEASVFYPRLRAWMCVECAAGWAAIDADRIPTAPEGVMTMAELVES